MTPAPTPPPPGPAARGFDARGAVDLGALAAAREAQAKAEAQAQAAREAAVRQAAEAGGDPAAAAAAQEGVYPGARVVAVDEPAFEAEVVNRSYLVPVVIDFWATWCEPCKQLSPLLEKLADEYDGRWVLATVDVDANPRLGQAFQIQSIPSLFAIVKGQPVPLFQGAQPEAQVRAVLDQLLVLAAENGVTGRVDGTAGAAPAVAPDQPPADPELDEASEAVERGDLDAAEAAYRRLLDRVPSSPDAKAGLGLIGLLKRTQGLDAQAVIERAIATPTDVEAVLPASDILVLARRPEDAFDLLLQAVRANAGDQRDAARVHLLTLFDVLGDADPAVAAARRSLAAALF